MVSRKLTVLDLNLSMSRDALDMFAPSSRDALSSVFLCRNAGSSGVLAPATASGFAVTTCKKSLAFAILARFNAIFCSRSSIF